MTFDYNRFHEVAALRALMHAARPLRENGDWCAIKREINVVGIPSVAVTVLWTNLKWNCTVVLFLFPCKSNFALSIVIKIWLITIKVS